jgi:hypothetical protein
MTSQNPRPDIYDPKTLAVMDQAFAAIWSVLRADDPFRDPRLFGVTVRKDRYCSLAFCPFAEPNRHAIQPSSVALSLASFQALARNSETVIGVRGSYFSVMRFASSWGDLSDL